MTGRLEKLSIKAFPTIDYKERDLIDEFKVMFNPSTYQQNYQIEYEAQQGQGTSGTPQKFRRIKPLEYTLEFLLDGTGASSDMPTQPDRGIAHLVDKFLTMTTKMDGSTHRTHFLIVHWGNLVSRCVLKSATIIYTLFLPNGYPLRAKVSASFSEAISDTLRVAKDGFNSPDLTHSRVVIEGDNLPLMTSRIYGDAHYYQDVARFNQLDRIDPLEAGRVIRFPPLVQLLGPGAGVRS